MKKSLLAATSFALFSLTPLQAQVLNFEGVAATYPFDPVAIRNFYNGGTSEAGTSGPNFGIDFSPNALAVCLNAFVNSALVDCSGASRGGLGDPASRFSALIFTEGGQTFMNRAAGFVGMFSFVYTALDDGAQFWVWSGLSGTGTLLGTRSLAATPIGSCDAFNAPFCPFVPMDLTFSGTALSVTFSGVADQVALDDVMFGVPRTSIVPEPNSAALMFAGLALVGLAARGRRT